MTVGGTKWAVVAGASFAVNNIITKLAYDAEISVPFFLAFRTTLSAVIIWVVASKRSTSSLGFKTVFLLGTLGAIGYTGQVLLFAEAIKRTSASTTVMCLYIFPVVVTVLGVALKRDTISATGIAALILGVTGVFLAIGVHHEGTELLGISLALLSGLTYGVLILFISSATALAPPLQFSAIVLTGMSVSLAVLALSSGGELRDVTGEAWRWVLLSSVMVAIGITAFATSVSRIGPARASVGNTMEPPSTALLAGIFLAEAMPARLFLGTALVVVALILLRSEQIKRTAIEVASETSEAG